MRKLDRADTWLFDEVVKELEKRFELKTVEAEMFLKKSNFLNLLEATPIQVHHDSPASWAIRIGKQMELKELAR